MICSASALLLLNVSAPNVALPDIGSGLAADFGALQWVLSAYALVLAATLLTGGALGDRHGHRRVFLLGLVGYAAASLGCALAATVEVLIGFRALQGAGAALLFPAGLALLAAEFSTGAERARAIGVWGASISAAIALGPLLGGLLVQGLGWRWIFAMPAALAVPTGVVAMRHLRDHRPVGAAPVDWLGTGALTVAVTSVLVVLLLGNDSGWASSLVIVLFVVAALALGTSCTSSIAWRFR